MPLGDAARRIRAAIPAEHLASLLCDVAETNQATELRLQDLDPSFCRVVEDASASADPARVRQALGFDALFPEFTVDDHVFQPPGYSLNALRGAHYCAVHVSPGRESFASVDTSWDGGAAVDGLLGAMRQKRR